jgi:hypothetical protein
LHGIKLTKNKVAFCSDEDYEILSLHKWYAHKDPKNGNYYAVRNIRLSNGKRKTEYMHKIVALNCKMNADLKTDHIDRNSLREATHSENCRNQNKLKSNSTSKFKGVTHRKSDGKWQSRIGFNYKRIWIGLFDDDISAAVAYDKKAIELFGEFANTNFKHQECVL